MTETTRFQKKEVEPISQEESTAYMAFCEEIRNRDNGIGRKAVVKRILDITGRVYGIQHSLARACAYMVGKGYLVKPRWMVKIKPWFSMFSTEELIDAYGKLHEEFKEPF